MLRTGTVSATESLIKRVHANVIHLVVSQRCRKTISKAIAIIHIHYSFSSKRNSLTFTGKGAFAWFYKIYRSHSRRIPIMQKSLYKSPPLFQFIKSKFLQIEKRLENRSFLFLTCMIKKRFKNPDKSPNSNYSNNKG